MTVSDLRRESIGEEKEKLKVIFFSEKLAILQFVGICYLFCKGDELLTNYTREYICLKSFIAYKYQGKGNKKTK